MRRDGVTAEKLSSAAGAMESTMAEARSPRRTRAWLWPLLAALVALVPHVLIVIGRAELFYDDHRRFSVPLGALAAQAVCRGELPAWNPYAGLGAPLMADPQ